MVEQSKENTPKTMEGRTMFCPKCSPENPGTLRVSQVLGADRLTKVRLIICDRASHCFSVLEERFQRAEAIAPTDLMYRDDLEHMRMLCAQQLRAAGLALEDDREFVAKLPTIETHFEERGTNPLGLQGPG